MNPLDLLSLSSRLWLDLSLLFLLGTPLTAYLWTRGALLARRHEAQDRAARAKRAREEVRA